MFIRRSLALLTFSLLFSASYAMTISDVLEPIHGLGTGAGTITHEGTNGSVISSVALSFYSDHGCTSYLDATGTIMSGNSMSFSNGTSVHLNPTSVYTLAAGLNLTMTAVQCVTIKAVDFITGSPLTYKTSGSALPAFDITCNSGSLSCTQTSSTNISVDGSQS